MSDSFDLEDPEVQEIIRIAKGSEYGGLWYSPKGAVYVSKEGKLTPLIYRPPKPKEEDE